jgi:hypothetical protein
VGAAPAVVVVSGHMVDAPDRLVPRFPPTEIDRVTAEAAAVLDRWGVDDTTTLVTGGARGADIIVAELARSRGASLVLCLSLPPEEFEKRSVALPGTDWSERFAALLEIAEVRVLDAEIDGNTDADVFERTNSWIIEVAHALGGPRPHAVIVWGGSSEDGPGGTGDFLRRLGYDGREGRLAKIDPTPRVR